ncbi:MAG TPA: HAD family acid phosphatase [Vicinamibacterales bacterium]|nr:HAD family acid phosphatase [Vicinamibacterales bacterium]
MNRFVLSTVLLLAAAGCAARSTAPAATAAATTATHENLNAVLWMQTAVEFEASAVQAYRLALLQLDTALADPRWTAAIEQQGDASSLPPAVIVDVDETVLDNSYYQARLIRDNRVFANDTWDLWVAEGRATAVPGALDFSQAAAKKGVTVFYVTNRMAKLEGATRQNLATLGFPLSDAVDTVLARGERPEWAASEKGPRRAFIAGNYRILMLIGDDLGDFVVNAAGTPAERQSRTAAQSDWWGRRWIMIPNPTYGSWERAVVAGAKDPVAARRAALKYQPPDR